MKVSQVLLSFPSLRGWPLPVDLNIHLIEGCEGTQSWRLGSIVRRNVKKKKKTSKKTKKQFILSCSDSSIEIR